MTIPQRHAKEAKESWARHIEVTNGGMLRDDESPNESPDEEGLKGRRLSAKEPDDVEFRYYLREESNRKKKKQEKRMKELYANPGIRKETVHGIMIDAGSSGSRLHIYEWHPRVLRNESEIQAAVNGTKLSYPGTESRWTDRLSPGIETFGHIQDPHELRKAIAVYLEPLMDFAKTVLRSKGKRFGEYPIFLRATAGMRIIDPTDRAEVISAVRALFHDKDYCPFAFIDEQARVISGEEEAAYDWTAVNFLLGRLIEESAGIGTVVNPQLSHGALDMGGASTQISFYDPNEDIMANLFKLQIGQSKHWNIYTHSFLFYGIVEALDRFQARLVDKKSNDERLAGIYNPCLPGGSKEKITTKIHFTDDGVETWQHDGKDDGTIEALLVNENALGDADACMTLTRELLHLEKNDWCDFDHQGDCSLAGIYQPGFPSRSGASSRFGEFIAFSNYYHIWNFLNLPERATIDELEVATRKACSLSQPKLVSFAGDRVDPDDDLNTYCFRSAYAFQLLRNGYGFQGNDMIRVTHVINGQKVGWALGAMLYEINTMPWHYEQSDESMGHVRLELTTLLLAATVLAAILAVSFILLNRERRLRQMSQYEPIKDHEK